MTRSQFVLGLGFIALGVLLLLDHAGQVTAWTVIADWWPSIVILSGLAQLATRPPNPVGGTLLVVVGGILLAWSLGGLATIGLMWPTLLVVLGLWLLISQRDRHTSVDQLDLVAWLDDRAATPEPGPLEGGNLTAILGDLELDLRHASLPPSGATLHTTTILGDIHLDIPDSWRLDVSGPELLGDITLQQRSQPPADAPVLRLRVLTILGDIIIRSHRWVPHTIATPASADIVPEGAVARHHPPERP